MQSRNNKSHAAFTLVELIIVIAIVALVITLSGWIDLNEINRGKNAELFTEKISRLFENTRNNALLWRAINWETPDSWRIRFDLTNKGTFATEYFDGIDWKTFSDEDYNFSVTDPEFIDFISCNNTWDISWAEWIVMFKGPTLLLDGWCSINDKSMRIGTYYLNYEWEVLINSVSWVIESK